MAVQFPLTFTSDAVSNVGDAAEPGITSNFLSLMTQSFATAVGGANGNGLPDDGMFAAGAFNPEVQLGFSNDNDGNNVAEINADGLSITITPTPGRYQQVHLFAVNTFGTSGATVRFSYASGADISSAITVPSWFEAPAGDFSSYSLIGGLDSYTNPSSSFNDDDVFNIFGFGFNTDDTRTLTSITVTKDSSPTNEPGVPPNTNRLTVFGATGVLEATPPVFNSLARQNPITETTDADSLVFRATFNEEVQNVDGADFVITGATTATITTVTPVNASTYDITISGGDLADFDGTVGVALTGAQNIQDLAGNNLPGTAPATNQTYTLQNLPVFNSLARQNPITETTDADSLVFRATFSEDVQNVDGADFDITGTTTATVTSVTPVNASTYDITVSGGDLDDFDGTVGVALTGAQNIQDLSANNLPGTAPATNQTYTLQNLPVFNSLVRQTPATETTDADSLVFRATFSEDVQNVDGADFDITGTTTATVTSVTPVNASTYDITVSGGNLAGFNGTVGLSLAGGQNITDLSTNALPGTAPTTNQTYTVQQVTAPPSPAPAPPAAAPAPTPLAPPPVPAPASNPVVAPDAVGNAVNSPAFTEFAQSSPEGAAAAEAIANTPVLLEALQTTPALTETIIDHPEVALAIADSEGLQGLLDAAPAFASALADYPAFALAFGELDATIAASTGTSLSDLLIGTPNLATALAQTPEALFALIGSAGAQFALELVQNPEIAIAMGANPKLASALAQSQDLLEQVSLDPTLIAFLIDPAVEGVIVAASKSAGLASAIATNPDLRDLLKSDPALGQALQASPHLADRIGQQPDFAALLPEILAFPAFQASATAQPLLDLLGQNPGLFDLSSNETFVQFVTAESPTLPKVLNLSARNADSLPNIIASVVGTNLPSAGANLQDLVALTAEAADTLINSPAAAEKWLDDPSSSGQQFRANLQSAAPEILDVVTQTLAASSNEASGLSPQGQQQASDVDPQVLLTATQSSPPLRDALRGNPRLLQNLTNKDEVLQNEEVLTDPSPDPTLLEITDIDATIAQLTQRRATAVRTLGRLRSVPGGSGGVGGPGGALGSNSTNGDVGSSSSGFGSPLGGPPSSGGFRSSRSSSGGSSSNTGQGSGTGGGSFRSSSGGLGRSSDGLALPDSSLSGRTSRNFGFSSGGSSSNTGQGSGTGGGSFSSSSGGSSSNTGQGSGAGSGGFGSPSGGFGSSSSGFGSPSGGFGSSSSGFGSPSGGPPGSSYLADRQQAEIDDIDRQISALRNRTSRLRQQRPGFGGRLGRIARNGEASLADASDSTASDSEEQAALVEISGTEAADRILGGSRSQVIQGSLGDDGLFGNRDADQLEGDAGNDRLYGGRGDDLLFGGPGSDWLSGDLDDDLLAGAEGNDAFVIGRGWGTDTITDFTLGEDGIVLRDDLTFDELTLVQVDNNVEIRVGDELIAVLEDINRDRLSRADFQAPPIEIEGTPGPDVILGGDGQQHIRAGAADDVLYGNQSRDTIEGGGGNDAIYGGKNNDVLNGGDGDDTIAGDLGNDLVTGGSGRDRFIVGLNRGLETILDFEKGVDQIWLDGEISFADLEFVASGGGDRPETTIRAFETEIAVLVGVDPTVLDANDFALAPQTAFGSANPEFLEPILITQPVVQYGRQDNDQLLGGLSDDSLFGGQGNDTLTGNSGNDLLSGDLGNDELVGGLGADVFQLRADGGSDLILDFNRAEGDKLGLVAPLTFNQLEITATAERTLLSLGGQVLATLPSVTTVDPTDFVTLAP